MSARARGDQATAALTWHIACWALSYALRE